MILPRYSMGIGDRFAHQGKAQLRAFIEAKKLGVQVAPVWNKSFREHSIIHSSPDDVRHEADDAVKTLGWSDPYFVDADHIGLKTVDHFLLSSTFFTLDVADYVGKRASDTDMNAFVEKYRKYIGTLQIPGITTRFELTEKTIRDCAAKFLYAIKEAGAIYRHIIASKTPDSFITEVSLDETDIPQTPLEMFLILGAIADEKIPAQTIAPRFSGRFNKGVEYVGDPAKFAAEFEQDVLVVRHAIQEFAMAPSLKLSLHSGSDKFSIYAPIHKTLKQHEAGLHLKTAGTTWLEEVIGLATAGGDGLAIAKEVYANAYGRFDELCGPYAMVIDIKKDRLPSIDTVQSWNGEHFANALRHNQKCAGYNPDFRQLIHVGYKVAAELGARYTNALDTYADAVGACVTTNIFERHLKPVFIGGF